MSPFVGDIVSLHYYANGQRLATRVDGTLYYVHSDLLGSTVAVSDAAGQAVGQGMNHERNERREAHERLSRLSPFSPLRGSPLT